MTSSTKIATVALDELAANIRQEAQQAEQHWNRAVEHAMRAGDLLLEAKASLPHGQWLPWLAANFDFTRQTASGYMRLAQHREQMEGAPSISAGLEALALPRAAEEPAPTAAERAAAAFEAAVEADKPSPVDPKVAIDALRERLAIASAADELWRIAAEAKTWRAWGLRTRRHADLEIERAFAALTDIMGHTERSVDGTVDGFVVPAVFAGDLPRWRENVERARAVVGRMRPWEADLAEKVVVLLATGYTAAGILEGAGAAS